MFKLPLPNEPIELTRDCEATVRWWDLSDKISNLHPKIDNPDDEDDPMTKVVFPKGTKFTLSYIFYNRRSTRIEAMNVMLRIKRGDCPEPILVNTYTFSFEAFNRFAQEIS